MKTLFILVVLGVAFAAASVEVEESNDVDIDQQIDDFVNEEPLSSDPAFDEVSELDPRRRRRRGARCLAVLCRCTRQHTRALRRQRARAVQRLKAKLRRLRNSRLAREIRYVLNRLKNALKPYLKKHPAFARRVAALAKKLKKIKAALIKRFKKKARGWKGCGCAVKYRPCPRRG